ncbi:MAG: hypothetical protein AVDCRST_MAG83-3693 [uncultured Arthrobacter sp.]|uniref:Uncharacterized protein n=1 Tax=uncultured Arthrobacter sp. TaxID=114050 RepID=A0A6J4JIP0_9MICC|nr:MAG: hypothetical protein AVDCRST_MAG83-3693 [uncultured Arthrobacter sp.]
MTGQPCATLTENGRVATAIALTSGEDGVFQLVWMMSPDKLHLVMLP